MKHILYIASAVAGSFITGAVFLTVAFMMSSGEDDASILYGMDTADDFLRQDKLA